MGSVFLEYVILASGSIVRMMVILRWMYVDKAVLDFVKHPQSVPFVVSIQGCPIGDVGAC